MSEHDASQNDGPLRSEERRAAARDRRVPVTGSDERYIEVGGLRVFCRCREGDGPAVVLLPGGMIDSTLLTWKYVVEAMPRHLRVFAPDPPGYGASDKPGDASYTTAYYVRFVRRFLDAVGIDRVRLAASSMGGAVALGFALKHPDRLDRLALSGGLGMQPRLPFHEAVYALSRISGIHVPIRRFLQLHPVAVQMAMPVAVYHWRNNTRELAEDAFAGVQDPRTLDAFLQWMRHDVLPHRLRSDFSDRLHEIRSPVLLLHGQHDWMMPVRYARRAAERLPDARLHVFDSSHLVPREFPDEFNRLLAAFFG